MDVHHHAVHRPCAHSSEGMRPVGSPGSGSGLCLADPEPPWFVIAKHVAHCARIHQGGIPSEAEDACIALSIVQLNSIRVKTEGFPAVLNRRKQVLCHAASLLARCGNPGPWGRNAASARHMCSSSSTWAHISGHQEQNTRLKCNLACSHSSHSVKRIRCYK